MFGREFIEEVIAVIGEGRNAISLVLLKALKIIDEICDHVSKAMRTYHVQKGSFVVRQLFKQTHHKLEIILADMDW